MATTKIGIYRKYTGPVPTDAAGKPLPKDEWTHKRPFVWVARWFGSDGKRHSKAFNIRREAERFAEAKQEKVRVGQGDPPARYTIETFHGDHAKLGRATLRPATLAMHLSTLAMFAEKVGWDRALQRVTQRDIEAYLAARKPLIEAPTLKKELKVLKRLFNIAIDRKFLAKGSNPCDSVPVPRVAKTRPVFIRAEDFMLLYSNAPGLIFRAILLMWYATGLRLSEAIHLTWDDVNIDNAEVIVSRHVRRGYVQAWSPKDHELRTIPMPQQLVELLRQMKASAPKGCPYVFMEAGRWDYYRERVDAKQWSEQTSLINNHLRRFKTICKKAGLRAFEIHDLRRSCITNWARKGLPIHVTQALAGHADIKTTQEYYLAVERGDFDIARKLQEEVIGGVSCVSVTDPKLTLSPDVRDVSGRKGFPKLPQSLDYRGKVNCTQHGSNVQPSVP